MKKPIIAIMVTALAGCAAPTAKRETFGAIKDELDKAAAPKPSAAMPTQVASALLPSLPAARPTSPKPIEERFSLALNNIPAPQFFTALGAGTRYNVLVHPEVNGVVSANLKDVTLFEALDSIRDMYGYDYTVDGNRIVIKPLTLQTRVYHINYLNGRRLGSSDTRVNSGINDGSTQPLNSGQSGQNSPYNTQNNQSQGQGQGTTGPSATVRGSESSRVSSASNSDFWYEIRESLKAIVGISDKEVDATGAPAAAASGLGSRARDGRSVVVSPQSGVIVVRAMPDELRAVSEYLKLAQVAVERQVILEAKILEVQLNDSYQAGINWASFANVMGIRDNRVSMGMVAPGTSLSSAATSNTLTTEIATTNPVTGNIGNSSLTALTSQSLVAAGNAAGSIFGLAFQTNNFAALLSFLETQGTVHVLSSPRIATLNNQKAILKVGTDDFFVTKVTANNTTNGNTTTTTPDVTLQQFFSGVVLDVTPQIDEQSNIILHVHPSVTQVSTQNKIVQLGTLGTLNLPLASSNTSETDSVVRGQDGQIIAIGGLMRQATTEGRSQVPGAGDVPVVGGLFRNTNQVTQKRELVILIKPTIVQGNGAWDRDVVESQRRINALDPATAKQVR